MNREARNAAVVGGSSFALVLLVYYALIILRVGLSETQTVILSVILSAAWLWLLLRLVPEQPVVVDVQPEHPCLRRDFEELPAQLPTDDEPIDAYGSDHMGYYHQEFIAINSFFKKYELGFRLRKDDVTLTPYTVVYGWKKANGVYTKALRAALDDLSLHIYGLRSRVGWSERVQAMVSEQPPALILPRVDPKVLTWDAHEWEPEKWHAMMGRTYAGASGRPATIDLNSPNQFSLLVGGTSGSGKSTMLDGLILSACEGASPEELRILFIDIDETAHQGKHFGPFRRLPHCAAFLTTVEDALQALRQVEKQLTGPENNYSHRTLLVIDEVQKLTRHADASVVTESKRLLKQIAGMGRGYGFSIVVSTQKPMAEIVPTELRDNCQARIAGRCKSNAQSAVILGEKEYDAAQLSVPAGSFVFHDDTQKYVFYSYLIEDLDAAIAEVSSRYAGRSAQPIVVDTREDDDYTDVADLESELAEILERSEPQRVQIPTALLAVFEEYANAETEELDRGGISAALQALNDGRQPTGADYYRLKAQVDELLLLFFEQNKRISGKNNE